MDYEISRGSTSSMWKWLSVALFLFSLIVGVNVQSQHVQAADISGHVSGLTADKAFYNGNPVTADEVANWEKFQSYQLTYKYQITPGTKVGDGDTAQVTLPNGATFNSEQSFPIKAADGTVIGTFHATAGSTFGHITFTDYYATHNNAMSGTINLYVSGPKTDVNPDGNDSYIAKNGYAWNGDWMGHTYPLDKNNRYQYAEWDAKINPNSKKLVNAVVTDTIQDPDKQSLALDDSGSPLLRLQYDDHTAVPQSAYSISYLPSTSNPTSFTIKFNGILDKPVNVLYLVKITDKGYRDNGDSLQPNNTIKITGTVKGNGTGGDSVINEKSGQAHANIILGGSGTGGGSGYSINVVKEWKGLPTGTDAPTTPAIEADLYANGKITDQKVTLNDSNHYKGTFDNLFEYDSGNNKIIYTVAEKSVPDGYKGTTDPQPVVTKDNTNTATLTNTYIPVTPATTSIHVKKDWTGVPKGVTTPDVTFTLYENGKATDKTLKLTNDNHYYGDFTNLPEKDASGKTIDYTVKETAVSGYKSESSEKSPDKNGLVTFTNQYIPKQTNITVKKDLGRCPIKY